MKTVSQLTATTPTPEKYSTGGLRGCTRIFSNTIFEPKAPRARAYAAVEAGALACLRNAERSAEGRA